MQLYSEYRFDEPWDGPHNSKLADRIPHVFHCPSFAKYYSRHGMETAQTKQLTNYVAVSGPGAVFDGDRPTAISDVTDGTSRTIAVAEARNHAVHWMQPDDVSEGELLIDLQSAVHDHHANHLGGIHALFADGSVRFISSHIAVPTFHGLVTRSGRETLGDY